MWSTFVMSRSNAQKRLSLTCSHLLYKYDKHGCIDGLHHIMSMFTSDAIAATLSRFSTREYFRAKRLFSFVWALLVPLGFSRKLKDKGKTSLRAKIFASGKPALEVYFKNIKDILSFQLLVSASVSALFDIVRCIPKYCCFKPKTKSCCLKFSRVFFPQWSLVSCEFANLPMLI